MMQLQRRTSGLHPERETEAHTDTQWHRNTERQRAENRDRLQEIPITDTQGIRK